jgi:DNA mismatch endonuclease (patch repair protein)
MGLVGDKWIGTERSRALSGRASKNTVPEVLLRQALHAAGARFRLHRRLAKGCTPDLVLPGRGVAVFVDGDFWHGCPVHYPDRLPAGPNAALWLAKFAAVRERDTRSTVLAQEAGWHVVRIWECEVHGEVRSAVARILSFPPAARTSDRATRRPLPKPSAGCTKLPS